MSTPTANERQWAQRFVKEFCDHDFLRPEQKQAIVNFLIERQAEVRERARTGALLEAKDAVRNLLNDIDNWV